ncbi:hypothetical protein BN971_02908 [Mycobacterium bohemicum DSM 44277]|uniref:Uncharacterized protein n=1 Tax=Mycobacterium bohemicum DSM 44277 TaxID=1236609 RepID=A0A0U0W8T1_MYCBE|nr:hypothetical protein BN971_02908 [Mycobacterium bohemicum DSM 44277]
MAAAATTWLLVRISPSADRMMPDPSSDWRPRSVSSITTLGTTFEATCSTLPGGMLAAGTLGAPEMSPPPLVPGVCIPTSTAVAATPPIPAETIAIVSAPTARSPARERFWGSIAGWRGIGGYIPVMGPLPPGIGPGPPGIWPGPVPPGTRIGPVPP